MNREKLSQSQIEDGLSTLDSAWSVANDELHRTVEFPSFLRAVEFINAMAPIAEKFDHHPDLRLSWRRVELSLSTHSSGGLTAFDFALAAELDHVIVRLVTVPD